MKKTLLGSVFTATAAIALMTPPVGAQFKSGTLTVPLYVTVTDRESRLVPNLEQEDFEV